MRSFKKPLVTPTPPVQFFKEDVSPHFSLTELTKSATALRYGLDNSCPSQDVYDALKALWVN